MIPPGQKSVLVRNWNKGKRVSDLARYSGYPETEIEAYLKTRPGYPGKIVNSGAAYAPKPRQTVVRARDRIVLPAPDVEDQDQVKPGPLSAEVRRKNVTLTRMPWDEANWFP